MSSVLIRLISSRPVRIYTSKFFRPLATNASSGNRANPDQLAHLEHVILDTAPKFFNEPLRLDLFTEDIIFIDNIRNVRVQGSTSYLLQINLIKVYHFVRYSSLKLELLNLVKHPEESCLKIRWRVVAKPGLIKLALFFWRYPIPDTWKDGLSTMHVNKDGKIYCHVCDNIDVERDDINAKDTKTIKTSLINRGLNV